MFTEKTFYCIYSREKGYFLNKTINNVLVGYKFDNIHEFDFEGVRIFKKYEEKDGRDLVKSLKKETPDALFITVKVVLYPSEED
ncbi:MAG: hypothetical protein QG614_574 [Patescibacteria group bacterium]|nr:hypothetical protein [Candidatus Paceibacterota bacterium]MBP9839613.1 hypothetical protein [Candidatus Paceibacterota bacterium]MDQ5922445.1 hypothetical protein [Patescibacteria group bacterium]MDQ5957599.1 hypothetical protein [Patescibacteria group bacterium]